MTRKRAIVAIELEQGNNSSEGKELKPDIAETAIGLEDKIESDPTKQSSPGDPPPVQIIY